MKLIIMNVKPLVTAVMVTGAHRARYALAEVAVKCFQNQTYPKKELLIINHGEIQLLNGQPNVRELRVRKAEHETIGDLRNIGLEEARGEFIICWDDDDWYSPNRIEIQLKAQCEESAVVLSQQIRLNLLNSCALYEKVLTGLAGTILHPRLVPFRYKSLTRGSDTRFLHCFKNKIIVLDNDPKIYIRTFHGLNIWDGNHIMHHLKSPDIFNRMDILDEDRTFVRQVLVEHATTYSRFKAAIRI